MTVVAALLLAAILPAGDSSQDFTRRIGQAQQAERARADMIARVSPAVVCVYSLINQDAGGSGVIIDPAGYGLTNYHVVAGMLATGMGKGGLSDGRLYNLRVLGIDPTGDVAMFRLLGGVEFPCAGLADSDAVRVGDYCIAMGNPFAMSEDYTPSVSMGIVSGIHRYQLGKGSTLIYTDCIQTDAAINPGNSGGPLFNMQGQVIGINGRISTNWRGRVNVGHGYAITSNQIRRFIPALRAGLPVEHGTLQGTLTRLADGRIVFDKLLEDGPAWNAGVRLGDRLLRFAGTDIESPNQFASLIGVYPENWPVAISFEHDGEVVHRIVRLETLPSGAIDTFKLNRKVMDQAISRLIERFQTSVADGPIDAAGQRWADLTRRLKGADLKIEGAERLLPSLDVVLKEMFVPAEQSYAGAFEHLGGDELIGLDDDGRVVRSQLLEVIQTRSDTTPETYVFRFDFDTGRLISLAAKSDNEPGAATLLFEGYDPTDRIRLPHRARVLAGKDGLDLRQTVTTIELLQVEHLR